MFASLKYQKEIYKIYFFYIKKKETIAKHTLLSILDKYLVA